MFRVIAFVVVFLSCAKVFAHHGGSEYALNQTVEFKAKLTRVDLINPHSWLYFDVVDKDGKISHHRCEMRSVHVLRRSGWTPDLFQVGQQITLEASPNRTDPNSCYLQTNMKEHPQNIKPTRSGHSIGHWEGDTLVVDTVGFLPGFLNTPVRNSEKLHVVERFSLDPNRMALTRAYIVEDPTYLKGKYAGSDTVFVADAPFNPGKCEELNFIDYSKQQKC